MLKSKSSNRALVRDCHAKGTDKIQFLICVKKIKTEYVAHYRAMVGFSEKLSQCNNNFFNMFWLRNTWHVLKYSNVSWFTRDNIRKNSEYWNLYFRSSFSNISSPANCWGAISQLWGLKGVNQNLAGKVKIVWDICSYGCYGLFVWPELFEPFPNAKITTCFFGDW